MSKQETEKTNELCKYLTDNYGWICQTNHGSIYAKKGFPDRTLIGWGNIYLIEFKSYATRIEPHQLNMMKKLHRRIPGHAFFFRFFKSQEGGQFLHPETGFDLGEVHGYDEFSN